MSRALVTGGAGFIGSHLVRRLLAGGRAVRVLDDFSTGRAANLEDVGSDLEVVRADVRDAEAVERAVLGCDVVFHLAALPSVARSVADPLTTNQVNVNGTLHVLKAARDCGRAGRVVVASSSSVYGSRVQLPARENAPARPISPYGVSKLATEAYALAFADSYGLETVALRFFNVFGPRQDPTSQYAGVVAAFCSSLLAGRSPVVYGDGEQSRDFTFVDNAVDALVAAATRPGVAGEVFNVACGEGHTLLEMLEVLRAAVPGAPGPRFEEPRRGDIRHSLAAIDRARDLLEYRPRVDFASGLERTLEWFHGRIRGLV